MLTQKTAFNKVKRFIGRERWHPENRYRQSLEVISRYGETPARSFAQRIKKLKPNINLKELEFSNDVEFNTLLAELATADNKIDALILWPGYQISSALDTLSKLQPKLKIITLPSEALSDDRLKNLDKLLTERLLFTYPYELPSNSNPRAFRVRKWMLAQRLEITDPKLQYQTYYSMTLAEFALDQILDDFYRDYFIEAIEHLAENNLNVGSFPSLALGPGQRFASKGAYIVQVEQQVEGERIKTLSEWIVP
jgi:hypothetical protein